MNFSLSRVLVLMRLGRGGDGSPQPEAIYIKWDTLGQWGTMIIQGIVRYEAVVALEQLPGPIRLFLLSILLLVSRLRYVKFLIVFLFIIVIT